MSVEQKSVAPRKVDLGPRPFQYQDAKLHCECVELTTLAAQFGTPLYVYSATQMVSRFRLFPRYFSANPLLVCYAVKANSSLAILRLLGREGSGFDIVSGGELERVRLACPEALSRVVFSGVGKQAWEIDAALEAGILLFNVESEAEIDLLADRAACKGTRARFALRVNPDVFAKTHPYISTGLREHKFGVDIERASELYKKAAALPSLEVAGVSVHIGSQIREIEPFRAALDRVAALLRELQAEGHAIRYVDLGGGLGIDYGLGADFDPERQFKAYAAALGPVLQEIGITLVLEPGRFLVAQAGGLLTRVVTTKRNGSKAYVVTDAAMNDLIRPALYQAHHEIVPVLEGNGGADEVYDVVGPVCESGDFFARDRELSRTEAGDLLLLLDAGAYGMSLASNYNSRGRSAEVLVKDNAAHLIRRRETIQDLVAQERLPEI